MHSGDAAGRERGVLVRRRARGVAAGLGAGAVAWVAAAAGQREEIVKDQRGRIGAGEPPDHIEAAGRPVNVAHQHEIRRPGRDTGFRLGECIRPFGGGRPGAEDVLRHPVMRQGQGLRQAPVGDARPADRTGARHRDDGERGAGFGRRPPPQDHRAADAGLGPGVERSPIRPGAGRPEDAVRLIELAGEGGNVEAEHPLAIEHAQPGHRRGTGQGKFEGEGDQRPRRQHVAVAQEEERLPRGGQGFRGAGLDEMFGVILMGDRGQSPGRGAIRHEHADPRPRLSVRQEGRAGRAGRGGVEGPARDAVFRWRNFARSRQVRCATRSR